MVGIIDEVCEAINFDGFGMRIGIHRVCYLVFIFIYKGKYYWWCRWNRYS